MWRNSRERSQWAELMAMLFNINRGQQSAKSAHDWMPDADKPRQKMPWEVNIEEQKVNIRAALELAAAINAGRGTMVN